MPPPPYRIVSAFPDLRFDKPTSIEELPDGRLLVTEMAGKILSFPNQSGVKAPDGTLLFGGIGGVTVVHPDRAANWTYSPEVVPTTIRIGGVAVPVDSALTISPDKNNLQVEFSALDYSAPEKPLITSY